MRIDPVPPDSRDSAERKLFERAERTYGFLPNTIRVMARGSRVGKLYLEAGKLNRNDTLSAVERELVAIATAAFNGCEYCLTAHTLAAGALGARTTAVAAARDAAAVDDPRADALLDLARAVLASRGRVSDEQLAVARAAGLDDTTMLDVVAVVAENTLGNFANNLARTEIDERMLP